MTKFIPGSTGNVYKDIDGNDCSLFHLVNESPGWACSRIREGEKAVAELAALKKLARGFVEANTTIQYWHMKDEFRAALQEKGE